MGPPVSAEIDPLYVEARRVLLDALEALFDQLDAIIVVGAQAVYVRAGAADVAIAPFTTDGDIALDPSRLRDTPKLGEAMEEAGFELRPKDKPEPGVWVVERDVAGQGARFPVDLIVPSELAAKAGRRGARLGAHGKLAARKIPGLEAAVMDNSTMSIESLDAADDRAIEVKVAGPLALLVAKAHKIQERLEQTRRPDRVIAKDAGDVYRLMQTSSPTDCARIAAKLMKDDRIGESVSSGVAYLTDQFRAPGTPGTTLAIAYVRGAVPEGRVRAVCNGFIAEFRKSLQQDFGRR